MAGKRFITCFLAGVLIMALQGCGGSRTSFSDGRPYVNEKLGIRIIPPKDWIISETKTFFEIRVVFLEPYAKDAAFSIDSTALPQNMYYVRWTFPGGKDVKRVRKTFYKLPVKHKKILEEGRGVFNGEPAYFMDCVYYDDKSRMKVHKKVYLMVRKGRLYKVSFEVEVGSYYEQNLSLVEEGLKTLEFSAAPATRQAGAVPAGI